MEWLIIISAVIFTAFISLCIAFYEQNKDRKNAEDYNDDYEFCIKCIGQLNESELYLSVIVHNWEINPNRRNILFKMGYIATDEIDLINPMVHPPVRIQRIKKT